LRVGAAARGYANDREHPTSEWRRPRPWGRKRRRDSTQRAAPVSGRERL